MKLILTFGIIVCLFFNGFAQRQQNVYFFKKNGKEVKLRDSADYIRIIRAPDSGRVYYELLEYYPENTLKRKGEVSSLPIIKLEGEVISYYKNGKTENRLTYKKNKLIDSAFYYFENGNLKETRFYFPVKNATEKPINSYKTVQIGDTLGKLFLDQYGNGKIKRNISKTVTEEGALKNGLKEGIWIEYNAEDNIYYEEEYTGGIFKGGLSRNESGIIDKYAIKEILPEFKGGIQAFYQYLSQNIKYPAESRKLNEEGRVVIKFVIEKDGSLTDLEVLKSLSHVLNEEALRVMSLSPKWKPGIQRGRPVRVSYSVPIVFSLGR